MKNGYNEDSCLHILLFFSHQCKTTVLFVPAMLEILKEENYEHDEDVTTMYYRLYHTCLLMNKKQKKTC